jgi:hypothetical protein
MRDVDPDGRLGLASRWHGAGELLDLRALRWVRSPIVPRRAPLGPRPTAPILTRHHLVSEQSDVLSANPLGRELVFTPLDGGPASHIPGAWAGRGLHACGSGTLVWSVQEDERVNVVGGPPVFPVSVFHPLPNRALQAAHVDTRIGRIAAATWRHVELFDIASADRLETRARFQLDDDVGDVRWVSFGGARLAAIAERTSGGFFAARRRGDLLVWELAGERSSRTSRLTLRSPLAEVGLAAMTGDGRYLAVVRPDHVVVVHDLDRCTSVELQGHRHELCLVRFTDGDRLLVTADFDGRVALRPRIADGFTPDLIEATIPREPIDMVESLAERQAGA